MSWTRLGAALAAVGAPAWRARQVEQARLAGARSWDDVHAIPRDLRARLGESLPLWSVEPETSVRSRDGTIKWRLRTGDGAHVETVLIAHARGRRTACVSSQVGCALGCRFCATASMGPGRDLAAEEIVDQAVIAARAASEAGARLVNVVFMGMGEPLQNLDAVLAACARLHDPHSLDLSARRLAISTAGWVPGIARLAEHPLPVRLAVSLHATDDRTRSRLMPVNRRYPIATLLGACRRYCDRSGRRVFVEYLLLDGVNDTPADARRLAKLLRDGRFHVNLIEYNPTAGPFRASDARRREAFRDALARAGIEASVRRSRGADVDAACGQLALGASRAPVSPRQARPAAYSSRSGA
jgi:23S rRNA (adenine2503-C2)-methyltransferase